MSLNDTISQHLRITLLRLLEETASYSLNESILADGTEPYGFTPGRDRVRTELAWLADQGLVELDDDPGIMVATLTTRGLDAAKGRVTVPGVRRPTPRMKRR
jgi:hypothetical protein